MSGTKEDIEISDKERLKKLEEKVDKFENLLTMNICFSFIGCMIFLFLPLFQFIWPGDLGFYNFIFIGFLVFYGILNWIILNKESPNQSIKINKPKKRKNYG